MKLAMFRSQDTAPRFGVVEDDHIIDAAETHRAHLRAIADDCSSETLIEALVPRDLIDFLAGGARSREALASSLAWLHRQSDASNLRGRWDRPLVQPLEHVVCEAPLGRPPKILCVGLNYRDHAEEQNARLPKNPILFGKYHPSIVGPYDDIVHPANTDQLDYEAELAVVIGRGGRHIPPTEVDRHIAGYTCFNDITARDIQFADRQWLRGKMGDTHAPIGPWVVTPDELGPLEDLSISLSVGGETLQKSRLGQMIFDVPTIVSFVSETVTLEPGDIIATGTPSGVGFARTPPRFLAIGEVVEMSIEGIGTLRNRVVG